MPGIEDRSGAEGKDTIFFGLAPVKHGIYSEAGTQGRRGSSDQKHHVAEEHLALIDRVCRIYPAQFLCDPAEDERKHPCPMPRVPHVH